MINYKYHHVLLFISCLVFLSGMGLLSFSTTKPMVTMGIVSMVVGILFLGVIGLQILADEITMNDFGATWVHHTREDMIIGAMMDAQSPADVELWAMKLYVLQQIKPSMFRGNEDWEMQLQKEERQIMMNTFSGLNFRQHEQEREVIQGGVQEQSA